MIYIIIQEKNTHDIFIYICNKWTWTKGFSFLTGPTNEVLKKIYWYKRKTIKHYEKDQGTKNKETQGRILRTKEEDEKKRKKIKTDREIASEQIRRKKKNSEMKNE